MTHFDDLSVCTYFGSTETPLLAVGWLSRDHLYARGPSSPSFVRTLVQLLIDPWQPVAFAGYHACEFCVLSGARNAITVNGETISIATNNLFVPADEVVYVAPSRILHYMDAHEYLPPDAFQRAVMSCPPMRSIEYLRGIRRHGIHRLATRNA